MRTSETDERIFSIQLKGALDGTSSEDLLSYLNNQIEAGYTRFLFNFSFVQFITSNGISTLLKIQNRLSSESGFSFAFYGLTEEVENVLQLLGLYKKLPICRSLLEAESYLRSSYHTLIENTKAQIKKDAESVSASSARQATDRIKFYYTGSPKTDKKGGDVSSLAVSSLEQLHATETHRVIETKAEAETILPIPAMEKLLEEKLSHLRNEIKATLSSELEKKFSVSKKTPPNLEELNVSMPSYIQSKSKKSGASFEKIFLCEACGIRLRVLRVGSHQCPNCKTEVYVNAYGNTRFIEKLNK